MAEETRDLTTCTHCGRAFVVPVAMLDLIDEGLYSLILECKSCDRLWTDVVEDADLEALEHAYDATLAAMALAAATPAERADR